MSIQIEKEKHPNQETHQMIMRLLTVAEMLIKPQTLHTSDASELDKRENSYQPIVPQKSNVSEVDV